MTVRKPDNRLKRFPHIAMRPAGKRSEAFLLDTGLAVWEVAWLERVYTGDSGAVSHHLDIDPQLVTEALRYARAFPEEIDPVIHAVENSSAEDLARTLPNLQVVDLKGSSSSSQPS